MSGRTSIRDSLLAAFCCLLWATPFVFTKITLEYLPPLTIAGLRFLMAGLIQIPLAGAALSWLFIRGEHPDLPTLGGMVLIVLGIIHSQRSPANG